VGSDCSELEISCRESHARAESMAPPRQSDSPRVHGDKLGHVSSLADDGESLSAIIDHRLSMRVFGGMRRIAELIMRGQFHIELPLVSGNEQELFPLTGICGLMLLGRPPRDPPQYRHLKIKARPWATA
jgi:hypothetical protein